MTTQEGVTSFGLNVCDVNADGWPDVIASSNAAADGTGVPRLYINAGGDLVEGWLTEPIGATNAVIGCSDVDRNGVLDLVINWDGYTTLLSRAFSPAFMVIRVVGADGTLNQHGRTVTVSPVGGPSLAMTLTIDGGSGYSAQGEYDLIVPTPWPGEYDISVRTTQGVVSTRGSSRQFVFIRSDGRVDSYPVTATARPAGIGGAIVSTPHFKW